MKRSIDKIFLIISIIIGIVLALPEEYIYDVFLGAAVTRIPVILVYIMVFALIMGIVLLIKGLQNGTFVNFGKIIAFTLLATIALGGFTALFEYIYEMEFNTERKEKAANTQYVFVIDDSGTMRANDFDFHRYEAVQEIVNNLEPTKNFAVYSFGNYTTCITKIGTEDSENYVLAKPAKHRTDATHLGKALETVLTEVSNENKDTNIIVLTDGEPSDMSLNSSAYNDIISQSSLKNTTISSVGFGSPDENFLNTLATDTNGVFVYADDISNLTTNMGTIVSKVSTSAAANRDLLGPRYDHTHGSFLYAFLRVLFLILLGAIWTVVKMLLVGEKKFMLSAMIWSFVLCAFAALICEVLNLLNIPGVLVRAIFLGLWACTIIPDKIYEKVTLNGSLHSEHAGPATNVADDFNNRNKGGAGRNAFL